MTLHIDLDNSYPPVWRRIEVDPDMRLDQLHQVIIAAMGWEDVHLHSFRLPGSELAEEVLPVLLTDEDVDESPEQPSDADAVLVLRGWADGPVHESHVRVGDVLHDVGDMLGYDYDMGDGWRHTITVENVRVRPSGEARAVFVDGDRACPPEDCGGPWVYNDIVMWLDGRASSEMQTDPEYVSEQIDWLPAAFDPEWFDKSAAAQRVSEQELRELPPPMPPSGALDEAVSRIADAVDTRGRRSLAHLLAFARLDAASLLLESVVTGGRPIADVQTVLVNEGGPLADLPPCLTEEACSAIVEPFCALLSGCGVDVGRGARPTQRLPQALRIDHELLSAAVQLDLVQVTDGRVRPHPHLPPVHTSRLLADVIARRLPVGDFPHSADAGVLALLTAASGAVNPAFGPTEGVMAAHSQRINQLCHDVVRGLGWHTLVGEAEEPAIAFWGGQTWSVLSILSDGPGLGSSLPRVDAVGFPDCTVPAAVAALARAALRMS